MGVIRFKPGVKIDGLAPSGVRILAALDGAAQTLKRDLTVTCGREGHAVTDPHTQGAALDVRTKDLPEGTIIALVAALKKTLGTDFTVLYETPDRPLGVLAALAFVNPAALAPHLHIQLRRGFGPYPPKEA